MVEFQPTEREQKAYMPLLLLFFFFLLLFLKYLFLFYFNIYFT